MTKSERTRQFIIEKASVLLNTKGMAGTSISDIMEATKMAKGGIYGNFENKEQICLEAFNYLSQRLNTKLEALINDKETYKEKLFALLDYYPQSAVKSTTGGCAMLNFGTEADDTNPQMKQRVAQAIKTSQQRIFNLLSQGIAAGEFKKTADPLQFSIKMFTMIEGALLATRVLGSIEQMEVVTGILKAEIESFTK
ncbi:TetR family transcriptional regulator [Pedobacter sp. P351]|uniref:TetR/AcrR family transcriptional regulator n=1 Tax=Pedobacter superstes TaxID=3133441 RepID=UPI0030B57C1A